MSLVNEILCAVSLVIFVDVIMNLIAFQFEVTVGSYFAGHRDWQRFSCFGNVSLFLEGLAGLHQSG